MQKIIANTSIAGSSPFKYRDPLLDVMKGFSIIWIVFIHTVWWSGTSYVPVTVRQLALMIDVPLIFFLSGWASSYHTPTVRAYIKRALSIYIPYLVMLVFLFLVLKYYDKNPTGIESLFQWAVFNYQFTPPQWECVLSSMWFLKVFIPIMLLSPFLSHAIVTRYIRLILLPVLLLYIILSTINMTPKSFLVFYLFFYCLGIQFRDFRPNSQLSVIVLIVSVALGFVLSGFMLSLQEHKFPPTAIYLLWSIPSLIVAQRIRATGAAFFEVRRDTCEMKFLGWMGRNMYLMYLYQGFGAMVIYRIADSLKTTNHWTVTLAACFAVNVCMGLALTYVYGAAARISKSFIGQLKQPA